MSVGAQFLRPAEVARRSGGEGRPRRQRHLGGVPVVDVVAPEHRPQLGHPRHPLVAQVPQQPERPPRPQHPGHLGRRPPDVHPVPHLGADHDVDVTVVDGQVLGAPGPHVGARHTRLEHGPHVRVGLDRHHVEAP